MLLSNLTLSMHLRNEFWLSLRILFYLNSTVSHFNENNQTLSYMFDLREKIYNFIINSLVRSVDIQTNKIHGSILFVFLYFCCIFQWNPLTQFLNGGGGASYRLNLLKINLPFRFICLYYNLSPVAVYYNKLLRY